MCSNIVTALLTSQTVNESYLLLRGRLTTAAMSSIEERGGGVHWLRRPLLSRLVLIFSANYVVPVVAMVTFWRGHLF